MGFTVAPDHHVAFCCRRLLSYPGPDEKATFRLQRTDLHLVCFRQCATLTELYLTVPGSFRFRPMQYQVESIVNIVKVSLLLPIRALELLVVLMLSFHPH